MGILDKMEASVYSLVETQWDTTCPSLSRYITDTIKKEDTYAKVEMASNQDEHFEKSWKPGGTMIGVSGKWASRVESTGSDHMGRWSWVDLRGKKGKMIRVISAYRISQEHVAQAGETTSCKQQVRSLLKRGVKNPNPKQVFLKDIGKFINNWRAKGPSNEVILMADMNEYVGDKRGLADFTMECNLVDSVSLLNPDLETDSTYLWG